MSHRCSTAEGAAPCLRTTSSRIVAASAGSSPSPPMQLSSCERGVAARGAGLGRRQGVGRGLAGSGVGKGHTSSRSWYRSESALAATRAAWGQSQGHSVTASQRQGHGQWSVARVGVRARLRLGSGVRVEARVQVKVGARVRWARLSVVVLEQEHEQGDEPLEVRLVQLLPVAAQVLDLSGKRPPAEFRCRIAPSSRQSATPEAARGSS